FLKDVGRIEALLAVYFLALLLEALIERELRQAMDRAGIEALPLYPEGRPCRCPTTRRVIDLFEPIQRHTLGARRSRADDACDRVDTPATPNPPSARGPDSSVRVLTDGPRKFTEKENQMCGK